MIRATANHNYYAYLLGLRTQAQSATNTRLEAIPGAWSPYWLDIDVNITDLRWETLVSIENAMVRDVVYA